MSRDKNVETVMNFIKLFEQKKFLEISDLFIEEVKLINPYHSDIFGFEIVGRREIIDMFSNIAENFSDLEFHIEEIIAFEEPTRVLAKFTGNLKFEKKSGYYENEYLFFFKFNEEGKIIETYEYFNPIKAAQAFGLLNKICN